MRFFWQNIYIKPYWILDARCWMLDIKKKYALYLIENRASRIQYLALYGSMLNYFVKV